jgi:hypothetical protein
VYRDEAHSFEELLEMDGSVKIHHRNIQAMAIEMYKSKNNIGTNIMKDIFIKRDNTADGPRTRFAQNNEFFLPQVNTVHYGHDSLRYFGCKIWAMIPDEIKSSETIGQFKKNIRNWYPHFCPCRLCHDYIGGVGYVTTFV